MQSAAMKEKQVRFGLGEFAGTTVDSGAKRTRRVLKVADEFIDTGIGSRIKALREAAKLNQDQLAELACCTGAHISDIERGASQPRIPMLRSIAAALSVHPAVVMLSEDEIKELLEARCPAYSLNESPAILQIVSNVKKVVDEAVAAGRAEDREKMLDAMRGVITPN